MNEKIMTPDGITWIKTETGNWQNRAYPSEVISATELRRRYGQMFANETY